MSRAKTRAVRASAPSDGDHSARQRGAARSTANLSAVRSAATPTASEPTLGEIPIISVAFSLGWELAELDLWTRLTPAATDAERGPCPGHADPDAELASVRELAVAQPHAIALPRIAARLARLRSEYPESAVPSTVPLGQAFEDASGPHNPEAEQCVCRLHQGLAASLNAADNRLVGAYDLGRELAYATQSPDSASDFLKDRANHDEISQPLADLSSAMPEHASRAVQLSLAAWHEWLARSAEEQRQGRLAHGADRLRALRLNPAARPLWRPAIDSGSAGEPEAGDSDYLMRQGQIWRSLLAGEKDVDSMLDTGNYEQAAHQLFRRGGTLLWRLAWTNKVLVAAIVALLASGIYLVASAASHDTAKILTVGTAVLGLFGVSVKTASSAVTRLCQQVGEQLWNAEIDVAAAEAITRLPHADQNKLRFDTLTDRHRAPGPARAPGPRGRFGALVVAP